MIKRFSQISSQDVATCGGKGASLGEMTQAGFPVPNGFILTTEAFGSSPHERNDKVLRAFDDLNCKFVAVRSSGTKEDGVEDSFAGQFDTYLFVTKEKLIEQIVECHDSINSDRIKSYCESKNINREEIKVAVVVQKMVNSDIAGVCFTLNPVNGNTDEIMIEAGYGIGEAVVSGVITPDNYIMHKESGEITKNIYEQTKKIVLDITKGGIKEEHIEFTIAKTQKLSDKYILELSELAKKIEIHYRKPMDIEWAIENGELYMLQARPITTHKNIKNNVIREKVLQRNFPPIAYSTSGYYEFNGINIGKIHWIRDREAMVAYKVQQVYLIQDKNSYYTTNINDLIQKIDESLDQEIDKNNQEIQEAMNIIPGKTFEDLKELNNIHGLVYGLMLAGMDLAVEVKEQINRTIKDQSPKFEGFLVTPRNKTAIQQEKDAIENFIKTGSIDNGKALEKIVLDFGYLHQDYFGKPWSIEEYKELIKKGIQHTSGMLEEYDLSQFSNYEKRLIDLFKKFVYMYEEGRNAMVRVFWAMRLTCNSLGISNEQLLYMTRDELNRIVDEKDLKNIISPNIIEKRKSAFGFYFDQGIYREYEGLEEVELLIKMMGIKYFWDKKSVVLNELKGSIAYPGYVKGKARLVFTQEDANLVEEGDIMISPMTQVEFLGGMHKCGGIITDEGGIICHAAIVSRELGKPCILATGSATHAIKDGDLIELDANNGIVRILKKA